MIVTKIEESGKGKYKIYIDEEFRFMLYRNDVIRYALKENSPVTEAVYRDILTNTVLKRAKLKALALLKVMDRTEQELIRKLGQSHYSGDVIEETVAYVKSYHYIDDAKYAENYINIRKNGRSKTQLKSELMRKGVEKELIEEAVSKEYGDEDAAIIRAIGKKTKDISQLSQEEKRKLSAYLYRKGFPVELIKKYVNGGSFEDV